MREANVVMIHAFSELATPLVITHRNFKGRLGRERDGEACRLLGCQ